jgi:hypothetical protein
MKALIDPSDLPSLLTSALHHTPSTSTSIMDNNHIDGLLSTMLSYAPPLYPKDPPPLPPHDFTWEAFGHGVKDFFAPLEFTKDPKSIVPNAEGLRNLGVEHGKTAKDLLPKASEAMQARAQDAMDHGWNILNVEDITYGGMKDAPYYANEFRGVLAPHVKSTAPVSGEEFAGRIKYSAYMFPLIDRLLHVAFYYGLVEFFFLRPNLDLYKEEVEDDPMGVATETVSDVGVRMGVFFFLAVVTLVLT